MLPAANALEWVEAWGIHVDMDQVRLFGKHCEMREKELWPRLEKRLPDDFNMNSPVQLRLYQSPFGRWAGQDLDGFDRVTLAAAQIGCRAPGPEGVQVSSWP